MVTVVTEEGSEAAGEGVSVETVAVATGSGTAAAAAATATTEGDTNAHSTKRLITKVLMCGLIGQTVTQLGWQWFLLAGWSTFSIIKQV